MKTKIYVDHGIEIFEEDKRFFIQYDAGAHVVANRLDEISEADAKLAMQGAEDAYHVLISLQKRLEVAGIDPYKCNV